MQDYILSSIPAVAPKAINIRGCAFLNMEKAAKTPININTASMRTELKKPAAVLSITAVLRSGITAAQIRPGTAGRIPEKAPMTYLLFENSASIFEMIQIIM